MSRSSATPSGSQGQGAVVPAVGFVDVYVEDRSGEAAPSEVAVRLRRRVAGALETREPSTPNEGLFDLTWSSFYEVAAGDGEVELPPVARTVLVCRHHVHSSLIHLEVERSVNP
ncbi:MAG: hypothetical protein AAGN82_17470 [Myxococcota bacterium]